MNIYSLNYVKPGFENEDGFTDSSQILVIEPGFYDGHVHLCQDYFMFLYL